MIDVSELVNISLTDKGKSEILEKFGEISPVNLERYFMEKGASQHEAAHASKEVQKAVSPGPAINQALPWIIGGIGVLSLIAILNGKRRRR